jgi:hypothetical protein
MSEGSGSGAGAHVRSGSHQAVVLVHGIGEQTPMETLRGFVETMWVENADIDAGSTDDGAARAAHAGWRASKKFDAAPSEDGHFNPVWWKPDSRTGSHELSRITTRRGYETPPADGDEGTPKGGVRTDFYEFYWADLTDGNTLDQVKDWFFMLLVRPPWRVPRSVLGAWLVMWALLVGVIVAVVGWIVASANDAVPTPTWVSIVGSGVLAAAYAAGIKFVLGYLGDIPRYTRSEPRNIAARREIRARGLALLRDLSDCGQYDRIVLVGHSLGSIVAYDLLSILWSERAKARSMTEGSDLHRAFATLRATADRLRARHDSLGDEAAEDEPRSSDELSAYRRAQRGVFAAMKQGGSDGRWLISDFVTVGSPLTHADFLLAEDEKALARDVAERRLPTSPPVDEGGSFLYRPEQGSPTWQAHHAAPFAAVQWTNVYDPASGILFGDLVSGPLRRLFGPGIEQHRVKIAKNRIPLWGRIFTHNSYWDRTTGGSDQLERLRGALDLLRAPASPTESVRDLKTSGVHERRRRKRAKIDRASGDE